MIALRAALACCVTALCLSGCSSPPPTLTWEDGEALTYMPTGSDWEVRSTGHLELAGDGCLVLKGLSLEQPMVLAGVPAGTEVTSGGEIVFPGLKPIALGAGLVFSQEPFHGTGADLPTEQPRTSTLPEACDPSLDVVLILPLADQ